MFNEKVELKNKLQFWQALCMDHRPHACWGSMKKPIAQPQPAKGGVDAWISRGGPAVPNFDSMSVDDVFAYVESKVSINPSSEVRQALIKQLIKHGASQRLDELRAKLGVSVPNFEKDVASVT